MNMLQRAIIHLSLILLFAFTQMGVITHEISHLNKPTQQTQPDKNAAAENCGQCIAYAQVVGGIPNSSFVVPETLSQFSLATAYVANLESVLTSPYSARAPPLASII
jgi:hypothetical protein